MVEAEDEKIKEIIGLGSGPVTPQEKNLQGIIGAASKPETKQPEQPSAAPAKKNKLAGFFDSLKKKSTKTVSVCEDCGRACKIGESKCEYCGGHCRGETTRTTFGHIITFPIYLVSFLASAYLFLNSLIATYIPYPEFIPLIWVGIFVIGAYVAYKLMKSSLALGIFGIVMTVILIAGLGIGTGYITGMTMPGTPSGVSSNPVIRSIMCIWDSLMGKADLTACSQNIVTPPTPQSVKKGSYDAISFKFGSDFTDPPYSLLPIQGNSTQIYQYMFPINIENPDEDNSVRDFSIVQRSGRRTEIYNSSGPGKDAGSIVELVPDRCRGNYYTQTTPPCTIKPNEKLVLTMDSQTDVENTLDSTLGVVVSAEYYYNASGENHFIIARSLQDLKSSPKMNPLTGPGPVDVAVYFSPENFASDAGRLPMDVYLFITIKNGGGGSATIRKISVEQLSDKSPLAQQSCRLANGKPFSDLATNAIVMTSELTNVCKYTLAESNRATDIPFYTILFIVKVEYLYRQSFSKDVYVNRIGEETI